VTALAQAVPVRAPQVPAAQSAATAGAPGAVQPPAPEPAKRFPAHCLWEVLIARIYEVFPLVCPICAGQMRLIPFITDGAEVRKILEHIGADSQAPRTSPARGPPLWDDCDAQAGEAVDAVPDWDVATQVAPNYEVDQRINW
jgi:hypothetical protein